MHAAVSYTHLDVYKRQVLGCKLSAERCDSALSYEVCHNRYAVSYTPLDVYKRQILGISLNQAVFFIFLCFFEFF